MENFIHFFNNREKALIIWVLIVLVVLLIKKDIRPSFLALLKALLARKIVTVLLIMLVYIALVIFAAYSAHLWDISLLKDTILWVLGTAFIMFMNYDQTNKERKYFQKVVLDNVKLVALLAVADTKKEYKLVKNLLQFLLTGFGIFLIIFAFVHVAGDFKDFLTIENAKEFLLTPLLTVLFLAFVYFLALYATYEALFTRVDILLRDQNKELIRFTKRQILRAYLLNLKKLHTFSTNCTTQLMAIENTSDVIRLTHQVWFLDKPR